MRSSYLTCLLYNPLPFRCIVNPSVHLCHKCQRDLALQLLLLLVRDGQGDTVVNAVLSLIALQPPVLDGSFEETWSDYAARALLLASDARARNVLGRSLLHPLTTGMGASTGYLVFPSPLLWYGQGDGVVLSSAASRLYRALLPAIGTFVAPHLSRAQSQQRARIRIGFASMNFYNHALGKALAGVVLRLAAFIDEFEVRHPYTSCPQNVLIIVVVGTPSRKFRFWR